MIAFAEAVQLWVCVATLPLAAGFVLLFGRPSERWYRTMFGWSLMTLAVAVNLWCVQTILFRIFGPTYPGRPALIIATAVLTFVAMALRLYVLVREQLRERGRHRGPTAHF